MRWNYQNTIGAILGLMVVAGIVLKSDYDDKYTMTFRKARECARWNIGDCNGILTSVEKVEWYEKMGVGYGCEPSKSQLEKFIEKYSGYEKKR